MLSRSCFNLLNLDDYSVIDRARIPKVMNVPGIISDFEEENKEVKKNERRIIVANQLPIKAYKDGKKWCFEWDKFALDTLILQLKDGLSQDLEIIYVGCLKAEVEVVDQEEVAQFLWDKFRCVPTFLSLELINKYYHGFCKHYLWPLFHYMLPITSSQGVRFDRKCWLAYVSANKIFADKVYEVINPDEDYVWIQDYHLMILPTMLRKKYNRIKVGFFLHSPFPSSEIYRTLPVRDEILRALLNCDLVGFQTFDYARHFLSCCSRMLGLDYQSKRGYIGIEYFGRTVTIKILPVGIHMGQIQNVMSLADTGKKAKELKEKYEGKILMLGIDDMDMFKGIGLKFLAMGHLLDQTPRLRGKVVLVQITNPPRSRGSDIQEVEEEVKRIASEINKKYGKPGYEPIVCVNGPVSTQDKIAHYAISECVVVNAVRDGMNLVPYEYTVSRQSSDNLDKALGIDSSAASRKSVIIVSEFIGCSPSLSGAIRVNPWDIESVSNAMFSAATMNDSEKELRHEKHYKYVSSHDVAYWARSFDQDLKRACSEHFHKRCWGIGLGLGFRVVALGPNFRKLSVEHIVSAYNRTNNRLILLDYDGTMLSEESVDKTPSEDDISILNGLCSDPKNVVFIVSGRGKDTLSKWFSPCPRLGLSAEHGYFTRWSKDSEWESRPVAADLDWKKIVLPIMERYTEATDGSSIEQKESALVWHHQHAGPDFGAWQAKELLDHLESVLANEPVVVKRGQHIVEVKPQDVSKGLVFENLLASMQSRGKAPDFVLCVGDDRSDEDMFESIASSLANNSLPDKAEVFACTVGQKPSMAKYYLDDPTEVIKMLQGLSAATAAVQLPPKSPVHQSSTEVITP
ncbi:putative alpha,alpha-trehalose-phosphate synthase [UDP-forming] 11 [Nicotiana tabacum]|uniref:alpha,alpha-trehalose-phosphate synthase (UDP-forming) n=3 Tax=Nicotiana TaxID=4085 RepID=A0A1S4B7N6_TOBAC|nr:PREDICTED: probable alpha,alpha-trehalose-phosphate synthase [UDP-forming] 11 isoform X1 [Nicotiana sylvestris]XP_016484891.1 PREDICTED: probable alpha,alpha-trehalose-phosphate synthase [UDP-forming] 11 [Nicotiana tabacum]